VSINLPQKHLHRIQVNGLIKAVDNVMNQIGFELEGEEKPILGSFFKKFLYKKKKGKSDEFIDNNFSKVLSKINNSEINIFSPDSTEKLSKSVINLIDALQQIDEGVLQLGSLIVIKVLINGKSTIIAQSLTPQFYEKISENPELFRIPRQFYDLLVDNKEEEDLNRHVNRFQSILNRPRIKRQRLNSLKLKEEIKNLGYILK